MCQIKLLNRTTDGILIYCNRSKTFQMLFKNINFNLTRLELNSLTKYCNEIDEKYWEWEMKNSIYPKKIPLPTTQENLMILLDVNDLLEIRELLNISENENHFISFREINYAILQN